MKTTKKIFSLFNLILFVGSFCFTSLGGYASTTNSLASNHLQKQFVSTYSSEDGGCSQLLFEKNENENENENESGMQIQVFVLPFLTSCFQYDIPESVLSTDQPLGIKYTSPIYISVCNFRV